MKTFIASSRHLVVSMLGAILVSTPMCLSAKNTGAPPISPEVAARLGSLEAQLQNLQYIVRRLHGNTAAVLEDSRSGSILDGEVASVEVILAFCQGPPPGPGCDDDNADFLLTSARLTEDDRRTIITFDAQTSNNFPEITAQLTDGVDDFISVVFNFYDATPTWLGGSQFSRTERSAFFWTPQVSSGKDFVDLEGFEIGSISVSIDTLFFNYNSSTGSSNPSLDVRVFFELAE